MFSKERCRLGIGRSTNIEFLTPLDTTGLDELVIGKVLGKGGFGTVSEVRDVSMSTSLDQKPTPSESRPSLVVKAISSRSASMKIPDKETDQGEVESRNFIAKHCIRNGGDARYAIKVLSPEVLQDPGRLCQGIVDMAVETRVLSSILHPNIVKMRALGASQNGEDGMFQPSYFILMDRLYDTLEKRLQKWQTRFNRTSGLAGRMTDRKGLKSAALYEERIVAAFDLSAALTYLHEQQILYRDLKPENIGFDIVSTVLKKIERDCKAVLSLSGESGRLTTKLSR